jgi:hypothetical protein
VVPAAPNSSAIPAIEPITLAVSIGRTNFLAVPSAILASASRYLMATRSFVGLPSWMAA